MKAKNLLKAGLAVGLIGGFALAASGPADAAKVRWKMQSTFGSSLPHLGTSGVRFVGNVKEMSGGELNIKFFEPGALVPSLECFDAVSKGSLESCWTTPGYHTSKYPALSFFTTVPFGPQIGEFLGWKWFGGGNDLKQKIYDKHNLIAFDSFAIGLGRRLAAIVGALNVLFELLWDINAWDDRRQTLLDQHFFDQYMGSLVDLSLDLSRLDAERRAGSERLETDHADVLVRCEFQQPVAAEILGKEQVREDHH